MQFSAIVAAASLLFTSLPLAQGQSSSGVLLTAIPVSESDDGLPPPPDSIWVVYDECADFREPKAIQSLTLSDTCDIYSEAGCNGQSMTFEAGFHTFSREFIAGSALCPKPEEANSEA
ncbi:hypothetical protein FQN54_006527 [Arachnomyces sp. PD_36]|nr:hypothetical protein FQN54_006527 [Arachnomyces sp. PD_36]